MLEAAQKQKYIVSIRFDIQLKKLARTKNWAAKHTLRISLNASCAGF